MEAIGIAYWELDYIFSLYVLMEEHGLSKNNSGCFFFGLSPTISIVYSILHYLNISTNFRELSSNGTKYMHILASGPEQQAVYFGHVKSGGNGEK